MLAKCTKIKQLVCACRNSQCKCYAGWKWGNVCASKDEEINASSLWEKCADQNVLNSCIIWETAVEICLCKSVNHYQLAEVILCGDSSVLSTLLNLAALSSHQHYPIDVLNVTIPLAKRATEAAWWFVKCGGIMSARQRELWEALLWEIEIKNLLQELIWTVRTHFCIWKLFLLFYNLKKCKIIHIN